MVTPAKFIPKFDIWHKFDDSRGNTSHYILMLTSRYFNPIFSKYFQNNFKKPLNGRQRTGDFAPIHTREYVSKQTVSLFVEWYLITGGQVREDGARRMS